MIYFHFLRFLAFSAVLLTFSANGQAPGDGPGDGTEPSQCVSEATIQISANPATVIFGQSSIVSWSVGLPARCQNVSVRLDGLSVSPNGNTSVAPSITSTFTIDVRESRLGVTSHKSRSTTVAVSYGPRVVIDPGVQNPVEVLINALTSPNPEQTVELCDVDIDLTGHTNIIIGNDRSLIASPACARGPRRLGPRIFVTDKRKNQALFRVIGDHVRISGFRLEGPTRDIARGDDEAKGVLIIPEASAEPIRDIEVSNMEIFHWAGVGVQVSDNVARAERGRFFNTNPNAVRVRGSYFHHNRHVGEGYGVASNSGAYATFEQNVFDENRHAIAGGVSRNKDALDYSGYTARDNLILSGGGRACLDRRRTGGIIGGVIGGIVGGLLGGPWGAIAGALAGGGIGYGIGGVCWQTHQIDMHGDQNRFYSSSNWQCGVAGETILIEGNTILYDSGLAIKIRGNPADKAVVDGNVFKHDSRSDAIAQNGACGWGDNITKPIDVKPNNVFGSEPTAELGKCDFFGDGQEDDFMATGATWWARSPATKQWRYLNTMTERLPQLQLGTVDNDNVCDVALRSASPNVPPRVYSKSGTAPWKRIVNLPIP